MKSNFSKMVISKERINAYGLSMAFVVSLLEFVANREKNKFFNYPANQFINDCIFLGLSPEFISRILKNLQRKKLIEISKESTNHNVVFKIIGDIEGSVEWEKYK